MKRKILLVLSIFLVASGLFLLTLIIFSFRNIDKGALQITSNIQSKVFLNGQEIGTTPLCMCEQDNTINVGDYEIRIEPSDTNFPAYIVRANVNAGVLTAVDRTFLPESLASSYILTLEKINTEKAELVITTIPDGAMVTIDSNPLSATPFRSESLSEGDHEVEIQKQGFAKKTIRLKTVNGHRLVVNSQLGTEGEILKTDNQGLTASPSAKITQTPEINKDTQKATILETPNGFLRVRSGAGTSFGEVGRVNTGESFDVLDEQNGWYKITTPDGEDGWISGDFAEIE